MFYSKVNRPKTIGNEVGRKEQPILGYKYNELGKKELIVKGIKDRYQEAQDRLPGVEIKTLIDRYTMGDIAALERVKGIYGDFTETPTTYIEAMNVVQNRTEAFNALPKEIKQDFENSAEQFIAAIGTEKFNKYFITKTPDREITPIQDPEVVKE